MQFSGSLKFLREVSKKGQFSNFCDDFLLQTALLKQHLLELPPPLNTFLHPNKNTLKTSQLVTAVQVCTLILHRHIYTDDAPA